MGGSLWVFGGGEGILLGRSDDLFAMTLEEEVLKRGSCVVTSASWSTTCSVLLPLLLLLLPQLAVSLLGSIVFITVTVVLSTDCRILMLRVCLCCNCSTGISCT